MNRAFVFDGGELGVDSGSAPSQSPWEFSGYSSAVKDEHARRNTTTLDHKISELRSRKETKAEENGRQIEDRAQRKAVGSRKRAESDEEEEEEEEEEGADEDVSEGAGEVEDASEGEGDTEGVETNGDNAREQPSEEEEEEEGGDEEDDSDDEAKRTHQAVTVVEEEGPASESAKHARKAKESFFPSSEGISFTASSFGELNISRPLVRACVALGYKQPTPIQAACIPLALTGRDICGSAVTGSGKTAAFGLPILERLLYRPSRIPAIRVLILTPTRELAVQVHSMLEKLAQFTDIRSCLVVGGLSSKVQEAALRTRPDIVVATPGRMIDHLQNSQSVGLEELAILVLDEADRLLGLGFTTEIHELVRLCPKNRQTMLFSATMTEEVDVLVKLSLNKPFRLSADPKTQRPSTLSEEIVKIRPSMESDKEAILLALCARTFTSKVIIFSGTKVEAHRLKIMFGLLGLKAAELHGNLTQTQRLDALEVFRKQEADFLLATDVAARGLDIAGVETIVNYECPANITTYVHRVGRTARAGRRGRAVTFVTEGDRALLKAVAKRGGRNLENRVVPREAIQKFLSKIEEMEGDIKSIMQEERVERVLRKAEMEANKAQNMMDHESEIYARPKKTWFLTEREKKMATQAATDVKFGRKGDKPGKMLSAEEAEERKKKEKRQREREKNLPRKKRRRLEAQREQAEDDDDDGDDDDGSGDEGTKRGPSKKSKGKKDERTGSSVVKMAYQRAKAAKGEERARESGKLPPKRRGSDVKKVFTKNRKEEMEEIFEKDMSSAKRKRPGMGGKGLGSKLGSKKPGKPGVSKRSFKSKARYKRRK